MRGQYHTYFTSNHDFIYFFKIFNSAAQENGWTEDKEDMAKVWKDKKVGRKRGMWKSTGGEPPGKNSSQGKNLNEDSDEKHERRGLKGVCLVVMVSLEFFFLLVECQCQPGGKPRLADSVNSSVLRFDCDMVGSRKGVIPSQRRLTSQMFQLFSILCNCQNLDLIRNFFGTIFTVSFPKILFHIFKPFSSKMFNV